MPRFFQFSIALVCALTGWLVVTPVIAEDAEVSDAQADARPSTGEQSDDIIARVGDLPISLNEIEIMLNSSGMVGMNIPAPGNPERNRFRLTVLDRIISADLIYLDALDKGADKNPVFQHDVGEFSDTMLVNLYRQKILVGEIPVSDEEIMKFYDNNIGSKTPFTKDVGMAIEAKLRKQKYTSRLETLRERLREGIQVEIDTEQLDPARDSGRDSATVVARIDQDPVTWGEVRTILAPARDTSTVETRTEALNDIIDRRIMLRKARAAGLENDPQFQKRLNEYRKVHLGVQYRSRLIEGFEPTDDEIRAYYDANRDRIMIPESRKIQMVVMETKEDAEKLKHMIESGEITIYQAAKDYSIDPNAKKTLGEMGWVEHGTGFPALDDLTFSLQLNEIGGPVQSPAGWNLVKVLEIKPAVHASISDADTWRTTRRKMIDERLKDYTVDLRKNHYKVEVYNDVLNRLLEAELVQGGEKSVEQSEAAMPKVQQETP